ncbi:VMAP-C domain-containing protein [Wenjunlia vitaminophila]|nr:hypothetical protein [Wenjunlia vitaminophila]
MVGVLEESMALADPRGRQQWRGELVDAVDGLELVELPTARQEFHQAVRRCADLDQGLATLVEITEFLAEAVAHRLRPLLDTWEALELYGGRDWTALHRALDFHLPGLSVLVADVTLGRVRLPASSVTAWDAFVHLSVHNAPPGGLPPGMAFLEHLLHQPEAASAVGEIRAWNDHFAQQWRLTAEVAGLRGHLAERRGPGGWDPGGDLQAAVIRSYIKVAPDLAPSDPPGRGPGDRSRYWLSSCVRYTESAELHPQPGVPDTPVARGELPHAVARLLRTMAEEWQSRADEVVLEFFLPVELLDEPVEWWDLNPNEGFPTPMIHRYPDIRIHSLERVQRRQHHHAWRRRWRRWSDVPANAALHWCTPGGRPDDEHLGEVYGEIGRQDEIMGMVLSAAPRGPRGRGSREVLLGLEHGVPLLVYHREDSGSEAFHSMVKEAMSEGGLANLPERTRQWKRDVSVKENPVIKNLTVIFDDPEQLLDGGPSAPATFLGGIE